jgi:hypothetical protein
MCIVLAVCCAIGCVKRTERIAVLEDGRIRLDTIFDGDTADVLGGDAVPNAATGWTIRDHHSTDDEGRKKLRREAHRLVEADAIPATYAAAGTRLEGIALRFPTTLSVEQRADGTYYHFKRVYERRPQAAHAYDKTRILESDEFKELTKDRDPEELTEEQRRKVARSLIEAHRAELTSFIDAAVLTCGDLPQDAVLAARAAALEAYDAIGAEAMDLILQDDDSASSELERIEEDAANRVQSAARAVMSKAGVSAVRIDAFIDAGKLADERHDITEELGDEEFVVMAHLPGRVIAHNSSDPWLDGTMTNRVEGDIMASEMHVKITTSEGQEADYQTQPYNIAWKFDGKALFDRDVVLMATSFVQNAQSADQ